MGDPYPYGLLDFQQLLSGRNHHDHLPELPCMGGVGATSGAAAPLLPNDYKDVVFSHGFDTNTFAPSNPTVTTASALEKGWVGFDDMGNNNRWPRQETLLLLEIRSRLDSKFRETNHKAPLWNQISRIMSEEYGYQRSGKKCKEKFENLYKYYKKTKEGKSGRQDVKHYRFFRQLEAICGESSSSTTTNNITTTSANYYQPPSMTFASDGEKVLHHNNNINKYCSKSLIGLSNNSSSDHQFETSSSENNNDDIKDMSAVTYMMMKQKQVEMDQKRESGKRKRLRVEVEEIVECHMKKMIESQEAWMEKMMSVVEQREQEMVYREEERMRDPIRFDQQQVHQLWAKERAWVATRDTALMEVVKKHLGKELITTDHHRYHQPMVVEEYEEEPQSKNCMVSGQNWRSQM
ncbi:hypothetical protein QN277_025370 [Acacia crassicarpa]|uniref:Myb-like domain-containing protein n=1 Tax=Acacia crassicarpa TaxID=499986 RepID=A0AAE1MIB3_9FABA|nr:hypothetical protein QN277_025370 [Acacia crassicarpa]